MLEFHDAVELYRKAAEQADQNDPVNHPSHYASGGIECIDAIQASMTPEEFQGYLKGNIMKYVWRWREKGGRQDLQKANWYLTKLLENTDDQS